MNKKRTRDRSVGAFFGVTDLALSRSLRLEYAAQRDAIKKHVERLIDQLQKR